MLLRIDVLGPIEITRAGYPVRLAEHGSHALLR
jgi:hypothetical protein